MNEHFIPLALAVPAALWAALLALAEGALAANPQLSVALPPVYAEKPERLRRGLAIGRVGLLALCAVALSGALRWWEDPALVAFGWALFVLVLTVVWADFLPRVIGLWKHAVVGRWAVRVTAATLTIPAPVFIAAGVIDRSFARMFGVAAPKGPASELAQGDMLLGVFALAETMVSEVMTPRVDVVAIDLHAEFDTVMREAAASEFSRFPVYDGDIDHIVGVLYAKDLLPATYGAYGKSDWQSLVRNAEIVPEVKTLDRQLRDFQRGPGHLAVVVDEFGGTAGIVTLEDVLEEIVGEIADERDEADAPAIVESSPGVFEVEGRASLEELAEALGTPLEHEEVTTAGGFVVAALGHVPSAGETTEVGDYRVTVLKVVKRGIARLKFERLRTTEETAVSSA